ncbi:MAG: MBL fold metallo-hydrolase [Lachnospiraceae bacterium]
MSGFRIKTIVLGAVSTNCYLVYGEEKKDAVIVDPADNAPYIIQQCVGSGLKPQAILLTHGHFDHIMAATELREHYGCPIYASAKEAAMLADYSLNLSGSCGTDQIGLEADFWLRDGEELSLAGFGWKVLETPGHTSGSVCYYIPEEEVLISGDTLFEESLGRTDLPTGNTAAIIRSIINVLFPLPDETMVYPGHGSPTSIGHEKQYNPVAAYQSR